MLRALSKSYDAFIHVILCENKLSNFKKLSSKLLLEEAKKKNGEIQNEALSIKRIRGYLRIYYKKLITTF